MNYKEIKIDIKHPHDTFFKKVFGDIRNTRDFLKSYLPNDLASNINFEKMRITDTEKLNLKYEKFFLDLSVDCKINGVQSEIYIVFEHKSYKDKLTLIQILNYCLLIWGDEIKNGKKYLTPIIPFIFYHDKLKSGFHKNFKDYFKVDEVLEKYLLDFKMLIFDTTEVSDEEIKNKIDNMFLTASLLLMKNIFKKPEELKAVFKAIIELKDDRKLMLFEYITTKKDLTKEKFSEIMIELKGDDMQSLAEIWMNEGKIKGEIKGEIRGRLKEIRESIKMILNLKFNRIGDSIFLSIQKIKEVEKLKEIQRAIFQLNDINQIKDIIKKRQ